MFYAMRSIRHHTETNRHMDVRRGGSEKSKSEASRLCTYEQVVAGVYKEWESLLAEKTSPVSKRWVGRLGEWLLLALVTLSPPVRRKMYSDLLVDDVCWNAAARRFKILVPIKFKNSTQSNISHVEVSNKLTKPMKLWLRYRHILNQTKGPKAAHHNARLFVNRNGRNVHGAMSRIFMSFGFRHCEIARLSPHIMRDIFITFFLESNPSLDRATLAAVATAMSTTVTMLFRHYAHRVGERAASLVADILDGTEPAHMRRLRALVASIDAESKKRGPNRGVLEQEADDVDLVLVDRPDLHGFSALLPSPPRTMMDDTAAAPLELMARAKSFNPRERGQRMSRGTAVGVYVPGRRRRTAAAAAAPAAAGAAAGAAAPAAAAAPKRKRDEANAESDDVRLAQSVAQFCRRRWGENKEQQEQPVLVMDMASYGVLHCDCKKPFTMSVISKAMEELQVDECVHFTSSKGRNVYIAVAKKIKELKEVVVAAVCTLQEMHALVGSVTCMDDYMELPDADTRAALYGSMRTSTGVPLYRQLGMASVRRMHAKVYYKK